MKPQSTAKPKPLVEKIEQLRAELRSRNPQDMAMRTVFTYLESQDNLGTFSFPWWGQMMRLTWPALQIESASPGLASRDDVLALILFHLSTSTGTPLTNRWVSFSDLPDGKFYAAAYQGYSGDVLKRSFGDDLARFHQSALQAGGQPWQSTSAAAQTGLQLPDTSYLFQPLPRLALLVIAWPGDEDFPATYQILFDASAPYHLPTDVCAILGGMLARRIAQS